MISKIEQESRIIMSSRNLLQGYFLFAGVITIEVNSTEVKCVWIFECFIFPEQT